MRLTGISRLCGLLSVALLSAVAWAQDEADVKAMGPIESTSTHIRRDVRPAEKASSRNATPAVATSPVAPPVPTGTSVRPPESRPVTHALNCAETLKPDVIVVSGGVSAKSVRPKDSTEQIDRQLAAIRAYAQSKDGKLLELERLRAARNPDNDRRDGDKSPFMQMQKIEVELPLSVDIDDAIERLLKLGLDRYGKDLRLDGNEQGRDFRTLTSYRIRDLDNKVHRMADACVDAEIKRVCGAQKARACANAVNWTQISAHSSNVVTTYGGRSEKSFKLQSPANRSSADAMVEGERFDVMSAAPVRISITGYQTLPAQSLD